MEWNSWFLKNLINSVSSIESSKLPTYTYIIIFISIIFELTVWYEVSFEFSFPLFNKLIELSFAQFKINICPLIILLLYSSIKFLAVWYELNSMKAEPYLYLFLREIIIFIILLS